MASPPLVVVRLTDADDVDPAIALGADAWIDHDVHIVAASGKLAPTIAA